MKFDCSPPQMLAMIPRITHVRVVARCAGLVITPPGSWVRRTRRLVQSGWQNLSSPRPPRRLGHGSAVSVQGLFRGASVLGSKTRERLDDWTGHLTDAYSPLWSRPPVRIHMAARIQDFSSIASDEQPRETTPPAGQFPVVHCVMGQDASLSL